MNAAILMASAVCILIGLFPRPGGTPAALGEPPARLLLQRGRGLPAVHPGRGGGLILTAKILEKGIKVPPWVSIEYLIYLPLFFCSQKVCDYTTFFDRKIDNAYTSTSSKSMYKLAEKTAMFDGAIDDLYRKSADTARRIADTTRSFDENMDHIYEAPGTSCAGWRKGPASLTGA
jgi:hypothetical protein